MGAALALGGMVGGCRAPPPLRVVEDDRHIDRVWLTLARGDVDGALEAAGAIRDETFRQRALHDVEQLRRGRAPVVSELWTRGSWLAARYLASPALASRRLAASRDEGLAGPALLLEEARRSSGVERRLSLTARVARGAPGAVEARTIQLETLLAAGRWEALLELDGPELDGFARVHLLRHRRDLRQGRLFAALDGLLDDLDQDRATPASLRMVRILLTTLPSREHEERLGAWLAAEAAEGALFRREVQRTRAVLEARRGRFDTARSALAEVEALSASDRRVIARWRARQAALAGTGAGDAEVPEAYVSRPASDGTSPVPREVRVEQARERSGAPDVQVRRVQDEWNLAARETYDAALDEGRVLDLEAFLERLDAAVATLPGAPTLSDAPRVDYGLLGTMLDSEALQDALPGCLVLGGEGLGRPPELSVYELVERRPVALPGRPGEVYDEYLVRQLRVPGLAASRGARYAGAGLDRVVFLDLDVLGIDPATVFTGEVGDAAWPVDDHLGRRSLSEPLDVAQRLRLAVAADHPEGVEGLRLQSLQLHEQRHVLDARAFLDEGWLGRLGTLFGAGLLPASVRAELERRAQLEALRRADDPRLPLAQALELLPVEGRRTADEHAVGYASLVHDVVTVLDRETWEGAVPLETLGLSRDHVLLHQLDRLPPEVLRSIAEAVEP